MNQSTLSYIMTYTIEYIKTLSAPSVKKLLREHGLTLTDVAREHRCSPSVVSRTVHKQASSKPVWQTMAKLLNGRRA